MQTKLEKIDAKVAEARKQLDKATAARDAAVAHLIKAADRIKLAQRALARLDRQRLEVRAANRAALLAAAKSRLVDGPVPAL